MKVSEQLKAAYQLIGAGKDESKWLKRNLAKDRSGGHVHPSDSRAICFCSLGALYASGGKFGEIENTAIVLRNTMGETIVHFNDSHNYAEVCAAWERAIAKAEQDEKDKP